MPLDAICLTAVAAELRDAVCGGKIDKIFQPARDEVILLIRGRENVRLLLSGNPAHPRAQLTQLSRENPDKPPMFCMLLRKYLTGGRILALTQPPMERIVDLRVETANELGDRVERRLVLEAMGRNSNLILLDEDGRILDSLRHVDTETSPQRPVLPGLFYRMPPARPKRDLAVEEDFAALIASAPEEPKTAQWLLDVFGGISPLQCRELAFRAAGDGEVRMGELEEKGRAALAAELLQLQKDIKEDTFTPFMLKRDGKPFDFSFRRILQYGLDMELKEYPSFSALLDEFYAVREAEEAIRARGSDLIKSVTNARDRALRKLAAQEKELEKTKGREALRRAGDLITANLYAMKRGMDCLRTVDFYDPEEKETEVRLDPLLTPQQNAARYYKNYNRAKTAEIMLTQQLEKGREDLEYLNSVLESIRLAEGERDLLEIRQELTDTGYLRRPAKAAKREKRVAGKPAEFTSTAGLSILVGKNNTQNDYLTTKLADKRDVWFHTQKIHGSHVILRTQGQTPDAGSMTEAACLAAWFSQGRGGEKIAVDYTPVRYVKKPSGARPGMVVYDPYETAYVTPDEELVKRLKK